MAYRLDAVVGDFDRLRSGTGAVPHAWVAPLKQRMGLLLPPTAVAEDPLLALRELSRGGPVAHVEAEFWGGDGYQTASLWENGERTWGPVHTSDFGGRREDWPINAALARLDVAPAGPGAPEYWDLFLEIGLGRGRDDEDWRRAALEASRAADYDEWCAIQEAARERDERDAAERAFHEPLSGVPAALNGREIMALLGIPQGRTIGAAIRHLQQLHLDRGSLTRAEAESELRAWAIHHGFVDRTTDSAGHRD